MQIFVSGLGTNIVQPSRARTRLTDLIIYSKGATVSALSMLFLKNNEIWPGHRFCYVHSCTLEVKSSSTEISKDREEESAVPVSQPQMEICFQTSIHIFITARIMKQYVAEEVPDIQQCVRHYSTPVERFKDFYQIQLLSFGLDMTYAFHFQHFI